MRTIIILGCLMAVACADHLGPDYHPVDRSYIPPGGADVGAASNVESSFVSGSHGPSSIDIRSGFGSFGGLDNSENYAAIETGNAGGASFVDTSSGQTSFASASAPSDYTTSQANYEAASNSVQSLPSDGGIEKEFYTFSAAEEDFAQPAATTQLENSIKQGIRVIFIKGPENNGLENAVISLAKQSAEQKTNIYVLTKQADLSELSNKLNAVNDNVHHKPEVHFVKYRTAEDAIHAQHAIQAEYEALGGPTQHFDGVASSLNFASKAPIAQPAATAATNDHEAMIITMGNVGSTYLPASVLRLFRL
ncbi:uncharacterized protein [Musca autumnalis]|uniref:uncharacterized protein n=1 Tax=Musca autumnalis TaxID=221902 RepID=UPI003CF2F1FE